MSEIDYLFDELLDQLNKNKTAGNSSQIRIEMVELVEIPDDEVEVIETSTETVLRPTKKARLEKKEKKRKKRGLLDLILLILFLIAAYFAAMIGGAYLDSKRESGEQFGMRSAYVYDYGSMFSPDESEGT